MPAKSIPAKRKQVSDMPESPPKRITRARAAKVPEKDSKVDQKITRITTASTKAAAPKSKPPASARANVTKRKTRADDAVSAVVGDEAQANEIGVQVMAAPSAAAKSRGQKAIQGVDLEEGSGDVPKRSRRPKAGGETTVAPTTKHEARPARGRPRRAAASTLDGEVTAVEISNAETEAAPVKKTRRAVATGATAATASKAAVLKKKVQFQGDQDKENVPMEAQGSRKSAMKAMLKAKPVRKATASRATRGRKAEGQTSSTPKTEVAPLSPKKVIQVAKTPSSSEDELSSEKAPDRALSNSPTKALFSPSKNVHEPALSSPHREGKTSSPVKQTSASVFASPRRPPQSPFKDGLRDSPRKINLNDSTARPVFSTAQAVSMTKQSLLLESPRKGKFMESSVSALLPPSQTPLKASLLGSPARRPPIKAPYCASVNKPKAQNGNLQVSPKRGDIFSSATVSSPLRAAKSPGHIMNVHRIDELGLETRKSSSFFKDQAEEITPILVDTPSKNKDQDEVEDQQDDVESMNDIFERPQDSVVEEKAADQESVTGLLEPDSAPGLTAYSIGSMALRRISIESQLSEDELASPDKKYAPTPLRRNGGEYHWDNTPVIAKNDSSLTPLAQQFSGWNTTSPDEQRPSRKQRGIFSFGGQLAGNTESVAPAEEPVKSSFFEDEMALIDKDKQIFDTSEPASEAQDVADLQTSMDSQASQEYGDENAIPSEANIPRAEQQAEDPTLNCTHATTITPAKQVLRQTRELCTVSKVPLRPSSEDSPLKLPRQRSKSLGGALAVLSDRKADDLVPVERPATPTLAATTLPQTPSSGLRLDPETPGRTGRKSTASDVLKGAIVFVDVHTTEGADASSIFTDLLTQMGARCVKQWNWNPRVSMGDSLDSGASPQANSSNGITSASKISITHVVYKDGGKRTLEKVRLSKGVVVCVGVGWVLDCEREDKWLDEAEYAIDTSLVPRGGHRRRKSMEPRALANLGGNLVPAVHETPAKAITISPTKEFLTFNTPASRRDTFILDPQPVTHAEAEELSRQQTPEAPATPVFAQIEDWQDDDLAGCSPTTPYYLSKGAELVQRTCPPKQRGGGLFPVTGNVEDESDPQMRQRLIAARRKSMQWASKTRSPLGRTVSYEH